MIALLISLATATATSTAAQPFGGGYTDELLRAAMRFGFSPTWLAAVMRAESGGDARALSPKGAIGLMQVMPQTYAEMQVELGLGADPWNVRDNLMAGTGYLRRLTDRYGATAALAAYNAGPGRFERWTQGAASLPLETQAYIGRVRLDDQRMRFDSRKISQAAGGMSPAASPLFPPADGRSLTSTTPLFSLSLSGKAPR